jgi:hypothetical protein
MYDPLALDRQRLEQDRIRREANCWPRRPVPRIRRRQQH